MFLPHSMHCKRGPSSVMTSPSICPLLHNVLLKTVLLKTIECTVYYDMIQCHNMIHIPDYCRITKDMKEKLLYVYSFILLCTNPLLISLTQKGTDTSSTYIQCGLYTCVCICELFTYVYMYNCALHLTHIILQ